METSSWQAQKNYFGAFIFICYVIAALVATFGITHSLWRQYKALKESTKQTVEARLQVFTVLAVLSFSVLSYHMLHFLIVRYGDWRQLRPYGNMEPNADLKFSSSVAINTAWDIWAWLSSSSLFQDFANTICSNASRYWWTSQALLMTMGWSVFMSVESAKRGTPKSLVFALISQILPVSFAMNLFFLSVLLHNEPIRFRKRSATQMQIWVQVAFVMSYFLLLSRAPAYVGHESFLTVVFLIRLWIFLPFLFFSQAPAPSVSETKSEPIVSASVGGLFLSFSVIFLAIQTVSSRREQAGSAFPVITAINDDPSVSALGYDYLLGLVSILSWRYMKPVIAPQRAS